jgi:hypothetical protein
MSSHYKLFFVKHLQIFELKNLKEKGNWKTYTSMGGLYHKEVLAYV